MKSYFSFIINLYLFSRYKGKEKLDSILAEICWMSKTRFANLKKREEEQREAGVQEEEIEETE